MPRRPSELTTREITRVADGVGRPCPAADDADLARRLQASSPRPDDDHWVYRTEERVRVLQGLFLADGSPWFARFALLLGASVVIATLGLANDQPAAVIAAMVVAPLMTPVLGIAASLTLGLIRRTGRLVLVVVCASVGAIALGWFISASLVVHEITAEELSRTEPRLRDLVIALAAGAAGMYSIVRKDLSSVMPGVAIAVALVPPLATIGITAELGEWELARGATLLYVINVLAIVLAAVGVLLATEFMRSPSLRNPAVAVAAVVTAALTVAVVVPVWHNSRRIDEEVTFTHHAEATVDGWSSDHPSHRVVGRTITPGAVTLVIAGSEEPSNLHRLRSALGTEDFPDPTLEVDWVQSDIITVDG
ncbi:MAG: DUF389 domain-containing protein [Microthrixaceae bacterium]